MLSVVGVCQFWDTLWYPENAKRWYDHLQNNHLVRRSCRGNC